MSTSTQRATLDDLMRTEGKAELIGGRIVKYMGTGVRPSEVAANIHASLRAHAKQTGKGKAFTNGVGYAVPEMLSGRESFAPDASFYTGALPTNLMDFIQGAPTFAAEVRSKSNYGPSAETEMELKRADYFAAGTLVVWDVDPLAETIDCYRADAPNQPVRFKKGDAADAEPAVPGWRIDVNEVFG
jgi:Uma2 family endonuclease